MIFAPRSFIFRIKGTFAIIPPGLFQIEAIGVSHVLSWDDFEYCALVVQIRSVGHDMVLYYSNNSLLGQYPICLKDHFLPQPPFLFVSQNEPSTSGSYYQRYVFASSSHLNGKLESLNNAPLPSITVALFACLVGFLKILRRVF